MSDDRERRARKLDKAWESFVDAVEAYKGNKALPPLFAKLILAKAVNIAPEMSAALFPGSDTYETCGQAARTSFCDLDFERGD